MTFRKSIQRNRRNRRLHPLLTTIGYMRHKIQFILLACILSITFITVGCKTSASTSPNTGSAGKSYSVPVAPPPFDTNAFPANPPENGRPTITYIGDTCFLKFTPGKPLEIKIRGMDLYPNHLEWSVSVDGVVPAIQGQDYDFSTFSDSLNGTNPANLESASILLSSNYTRQIQSGDTLTVSAEIVSASEQILRETLGEIKTAQAQASELIAETNAPNLKANIQTVMEVNNRLFAVQDVYAAQFKTNLNLVDQYLQAAKANPSDPLTKKELASVPEIYRRSSSLLIATALSKNRFPIVTSGFRSFKLFTSEDFRNKFLNTRLDLNDIKAFPMSDEQAKELFGRILSEHFYVVLFSAANNTEQERLINTGLINAFGRALVYNSSRRDAPVYSIPIQVSPESLQQVYSDLAGTKWKTSREWVFRSLTLAGGVASAFASAYGGTPDLIKGLGLATGTVIPGGETLWPDQYPNYLANVVNYGMPELVKVPARSSIGFKVLFFSKDNISTVVSDPGMYSKELNTDGEYIVKEPNTKVVYLSFDTLEVPYEGATITNQISGTLTASVQPPNLNLESGQKAAFSVNVSGTPPFTFQWFYNNKPDTNQTAAGYSIDAVTTNNIGSYSVKVTDGNKASFMTQPALLQIH